MNLARRVAPTFLSHRPEVNRRVPTLFVLMMGTVP